MISASVSTDCNMWSSSVMVLRGLDPGNSAVQQAFRCEGHFCNGSTNCCFPDMFWVTSVIKETPAGKKTKRTQRLSSDLRAGPQCEISELWGRRMMFRLMRERQKMVKKNPVLTWGCELIQLQHQSAQTRKRQPDSCFRLSRRRRRETQGLFKKTCHHGHHEAFLRRLHFWKHSGPQTEQEYQLVVSMKRWTHHLDSVTQSTLDSIYQSELLNASSTYMWTSPHLLHPLGSDLLLLSRTHLHFVLHPFLPFVLLSSSPVSPLHSVFGFPLLKNLVQVKSPSVVHQEVFHLNHRLVTNHIWDRLEVPAILPDGCMSLDERLSHWPITDWEI